MADSLDTMLKLIEKLQEVDRLSKRVEELEKQVEKLNNVTIEQRNKNIVETLNDGSIEGRIDTAAELAIEHFKLIPPTSERGRRR